MLSLRRVVNQTKLWLIYLQEKILQIQTCLLNSQSNTRNYCCYDRFLKDDQICQEWKCIWPVLDMKLQKQEKMMAKLQNFHMHVGSTFSERVGA